MTLARVGITTAIQRQRWVEAKQRELAEMKRARALGIQVSTATPISQAVADYMADCQARLRTSTVARYRRAVEDLAEWVAERGRRHVEDLDPRDVWSYRDALMRTPAAERTRNVQLSAIRVALEWWRARRLTPKLSGDDIRDACKQIAAPKTQPRCLRAPELRQLLEDAREHPALPLIVVALLTGMRRCEVGLLEWSEVDIDAGEIRLGTRTKTRSARTIDLSVCPSVVDILRAWPRVGTRVFDRRRSTMNAWSAELREYVQWTWKDLRSTCGTWLTCAPGIWGASSAYRTARQLGHTVQIAERYYLGVLRGIDPETRTLEGAMGISELLSKTAWSSDQGPVGGSL